jgi:predicted RNase H-like HicB family nuclease
MLQTMREIVFNVERDEVSSSFVASWDEPDGNGGITTQGQDLSELQAMVREAVLCHFEEGKAPERIRLHFVSDPVLATA